MKLETIIRIIKTPRCWARNYKTSQTLDSWLKRALLIPAITEIGQHTCKVDGKLLWIENYPYAYGNLRNIRRLPSRGTVFMLHDELLKHKEYNIPVDLEKEIVEALLDKNIVEQ